MKKGNRKLTLIIAIVLVIAAVFQNLIRFITDLLWFFEVGYEAVFLTKLATQLIIGIPLFLIVGALGFLYLLAIKKGYYKSVRLSVVDKAADKKSNLIALGLSLAFAGIVTYFVINVTWFDALQFINGTSFGIQDPLFHNDISFYVFRLRLIEQISGIAVGVIIGLLILTAIYYAILAIFKKPPVIILEDSEDGDDGEDGDDNFGGRFRVVEGGKNFGGFGPLGEFMEELQQAFGGGGGPQHTRPSAPQKPMGDTFGELWGIASKQVTVLGVLFFLIIGVNFFLSQFNLLYSTGGVLYGAGYTDVNVTLLMYRILAALSVLGAVGFAVGMKNKKIKTILFAPALMVAVGIIGAGAAFVVQNYVVSSDEINMESRYLERNIRFTQNAYKLNNVNIRDFPVSNTLTRGDIDNNYETISNIRINDYDPVRRFYNNVQTIRPYYTFTDVSVDRYMINGDYTQVYIAAREIDDTQRSPIPQTFLNRHIKYTHGYGITLSRVDKISSSGLPEMLIRNIPPESDVEEITISRPEGRPEIYFGQVTHDFILVNTTEPGFDYPIGGSDDGRNAEVLRYEGDAGIRLNFINRVLFAIRERNLRILVSGALTNESKIVINRNIMQRVHTIMPYLSYDNEPYMVTVDGRLFWIIDAYTVSGSYPYSEPYDRRNVNYIRNSVKVAIDAFNGTVNYYIVDPDDPIAATYKNIFPTLFKDIGQMDEMSPNLKKHIRYPNLMLNIQANMYRRYHMNDVTMFYQNEDLWDIATESYGSTEQQMVPNYYIMKLPGEQRAEFVNTIPFTPRDRRNLSALFVARNDGEHYGELILFQLPKGRQIPGPMQVDAQIEQDGQISQDIALWSQSGSIVNRGNMFVIPIENSFLYVKPIYLEAEAGSIPEVRRVVVAYGVPDGDGVRIAYQPTLEEALKELFGASDGALPETAQPGESGQPSHGDVPRDISELIDLAAQAFDNAQAAQRNGNWAAYGQYLGQLELYLNQLQSIQ
ncbi:MAG: UPF0182 family protein [Oscillospiraceae bacterium]|nr:UPF0182 family protein [Oscillospiraceae bacterium]